MTEDTKSPQERFEEFSNADYLTSVESEYVVCGPSHFLLLSLELYDSSGIARNAEDPIHTARIVVDPQRANELLQAVKSGLETILAHNK